MPDLTLMKTLLTLVLLLTTAAAQAADDTCAKAYETAQELRADGLLRAARDVLRMCVRPSCPTFIRSDCGKWLSDVETSLPTVAFAVRMRGQDVEAVNVTCDEELLTERLDGRPIALDPGKHSCRFEAAGAQTAQLDVLMAEGHKNRIVQVDLTPAGPRPVSIPAAAPAATAPAATAAATTSRAARVGPPRLPPADLTERQVRNRLAIAFAATALAGVGSFVGLGLKGLNQERNLAAGCAPGCGDADVEGVRATYILADVALGVGLASATAAAYILITGGKSKPEGPIRAAGTSLWATPLPDGAAVAVRSRF
jgi:hypothetical protein